MKFKGDNPVPIEGLRLIRQGLSERQQHQLVRTILAIAKSAPFFKPSMPRTGKPFSVEMTNAGSLGWVSDKGGYRYQPRHPDTERPWPPIPELLIQAWNQHADYPYLPEACLVNYYRGKARMGSHQDRDEDDFSAPVLSISLGDDAVFHVGGTRRSDKKTRMTLKSGDILVLGGEARLVYHGIDRILPGSSGLLPEGGRINLTLRRVTKPTE